MEMLLFHLLRNHSNSQVSWYMPVISALLGRLRQEDPEFEANLDYIARPSLKIKQNKIQKQITTS
jgi:hypothetical protein